MKQVIRKIGMFYNIHSMDVPDFIVHTLKTNAEEEDSLSIIWTLASKILHIRLSWDVVYSMGIQSITS